MSPDDFDEEYKPIKNPHDKDAGWDGCLFATHGVEHNFVKNQSSKRVWTLLSDNTLVSGYHLIDRVGYIVTLLPWAEDTTVSL
jgi:hypothetical protein